MKGSDALHILDETVLAFHNLTQLQRLDIVNCPPLAEKHLQMLTSLKILVIYGSSITFQLPARSDATWQLPVSTLEIEWWSGSWKEVTRLVTHLPELSCLVIRSCEKITGLGVEVQQQTAASLSLPAASSGVKLQDEQEEIVQEVEVEEEEEEDDDGLLLLPAHLSYSLQVLSIDGCPELVLSCGTGGGGGLQSMGSLKKIKIYECPKFLSAYSECPFPSSLQSLFLVGGMEGMETLAPLSNLTSLKELDILDLGDDLRCDGLLPLLTQGQQLTALCVRGCPNFFAGIKDPAPAPAQAAVSKLQQLFTDDIAGVLTAPICRLLSSSLTILSLCDDTEEVERLSKEQEEALSLLTSLQELEIRFCFKLWCLPARLHKLTNLKRLQIYYCPAMRSLPKNGLPTSLQVLDVRECIKLRCLPAGLHKLTNLNKLKTNNCPAIRSLPKNGLPSSLQELIVRGCTKLQCLPDGLHKLTNLKRLRIQSCPAIRSLPKNGLPTSLQELDVSDCGNEELTRRCIRLMGSIPLIRLEF